MFYNLLDSHLISAKQAIKFANKYIKYITKEKNNHVYKSIKGQYNY